jgi:hypothetical protein
VIAAAGFNSNWVEKTGEGFLIEGDILLTKDQLQEMAGTTPTNNFIVANEEHYRTYNVVKHSKYRLQNNNRKINSGFPAHYSTGLNQSIAGIIVII